MNVEMIFNEFAKYAETNRDYYTFGKHGIIEDVLAFMGLPSKKFFGASSAVHADNLETLHNFLTTHGKADAWNDGVGIPIGRSEMSSIIWSIK